MRGTCKYVDDHRTVPSSASLIHCWWRAALIFPATKNNRRAGETLDVSSRSDAFETIVTPFIFEHSSSLAAPYTSYRFPSNYKNLIIRKLNDSDKKTIPWAKKGTCKYSSQPPCFTLSAVVEKWVLEIITGLHEKENKKLATNETAGHEPTVFCQRRLNASNKHEIHGTKGDSAFGWRARNGAKQRSDTQRSRELYGFQSSRAKRPVKRVYLMESGVSRRHTSARAVTRRPRSRQAKRATRYAPPTSMPRNYWRQNDQATAVTRRQRDELDTHRGHELIHGECRRRLSSSTEILFRSRAASWIVFDVWRDGRGR